MPLLLALAKLKSPWATSLENQTKEPMHSYESEGMSGRRPAGKFYHDSEALDRRIILERIPTMTMEDLRILNLETYSQSHSLKQLIGELKLQESPNWDNISSMRFICFVLDKFAITSREEIRYRNKLQELEIKLANLERERLTILQRCKKNNSKHMSNHKGFYYKHVKKKPRK